MKYAHFIFIAALAVLIPHAVEAQAVPLIVGSVRDQTGTPIQGALVSPPGAGSKGVLTDAAGTFALQSRKASRLQISCPYCVGVVVAVTPDQPVVAIVHRYEALRTAAPSRDDLASLPYAHAASALSLRPFAMLEDSASLLPGARIADRGLASAGGLVRIADVPNYDIVTNASPFTTIPDFYARAFVVTSPLDAFRYGDRAGAGVFNVDPAPNGSTKAQLIGGGDTSIGYARADTTAQFSLGTSSNALDVRSAAHVATTIAIGNDARVRFSGDLAQGRATPNSDDYLASSFGAVRARYDRVRQSDLHATLSADRGTYALDSATPTSALWSDISGSVGIAPLTPIGFFADLGWRASSGQYDAQPQTIPLENATISQQYVDAGVRVERTGYTVAAGIGAFDVGYQRASLGALPLRAQIVAPSVRLTLAPGRRFSAELGTAQSFTLPTILEAYGNAPFTNVLAYNRNALVTANLDYTDFARLRVELTGATQAVRNRDSGSVDAVGISTTWQVSPLFSLRAWAMHVSDSTIPAVQPLYHLATPAATVGSLWLTYQNAARVRIDAIWRRDLLDAASDEHLDGSLSAPLAHNLRWFIGSERYHRTRYLDLGLRLTR